MTHHTDAELLPCPFCGAAPKIDGQGAVRWIKCPDDSACGSGGMAIGIPADDLARGIASWNRRAPVAPVPQEPTSKQVVLGAGALLGQPENTADNRHPDWHTAVEKARSVYLAMLAAAPQPPEDNPVELHQIKNAAPLQFLEPVAKVEDGGLKWHIPDRGYSLPVRYLQGTHKLYTEQQVRELLAQHGIK